MVGGDVGSREFPAPFLAWGNRIALLGSLLPQVSFFTVCGPGLSLYPVWVLEAQLETHLSHLGRFERL